jgi:hypothetical protein
VGHSFKPSHCEIHRDILASGGMSAKFIDVLATAVRRVNFIKNSALNILLFSNFCEEMGASFQQLLLHVVVRW